MTISNINLISIIILIKFYKSIIYIFILIIACVTYLLFKLLLDMLYLFLQMHDNLKIFRYLINGS